MIHQSATARVVERTRPPSGSDFFPPSREMNAIPGRYGQEEVPWETVIIHLHYVGPYSHWWVAEAWQSREVPGTWEAYGYVTILQGGTPEWCHISLTELQRVSLAMPVPPVGPWRSRADSDSKRFYIDRDRAWTPRPANQCVPGLLQAQNPVDVDPASEQGRRRCSLASRADADELDPGQSPNLTSAGQDLVHP